MSSDMRVHYISAVADDRFTPEAKASRPQLAHMPFGWGPRNCIGLRFAMLEAKIALMEILRQFSFARAPETVVSTKAYHVSMDCGSY